ncbi:hypothetical protein GX441_06000 [bacterium]|nr:hypothetical protein [bacterium]
MMVSDELIKYIELRGIKTPESRRRFLFPRLSDHYDPYLLNDMQRAVDALINALKRRHKILVWGHADLDGIASASLLKLALEDLGASNVMIRIPAGDDTEGFGLEQNEMENFAAKGGNLIVTVDVGVTNTAEALTAKSLGLDLIITDHHEIVDSMPQAIVINPKIPLSKYPWRELSGSGVVLKVVCALYNKLVGLSIEELNLLKPHYWIFSALGTISDRCPLIDENRLIVKEGMARLRSGIWPSLNVWLAEMGFDAESLSVFDLYSRGIAPFYAADPEEGVKLLLSFDDEWLHNRYGELKGLALEWQRGKQKMIDLAEKLARQIGGVIVTVSDKIDSDYLGTVAHALRERYNLPAMALTPRREGLWHAECRGLEGTDLLGYLTLFKDMFLTFGGHKKACGFTVKQGRLDEFLEMLENQPLEVGDEKEKVNDEVFVLGIKGDLSDWILLSPFGEGNPPPRFLAHRVILEETYDGYKADGVQVYIPLALRPLSQRKSVVDIEYTINTDGKIRLLSIVQSSKS